MWPRKLYVKSFKSLKPLINDYLFILEIARINKIKIQKNSPFNSLEFNYCNFIHDSQEKDSFFKKNRYNN